MPLNESAETGLGRGIRLLDAIAQKGQIRFTDAKNLLEVSSSAASRLLTILMDMDVVIKTNGSTYSFGPKVNRWFITVPELRTIANPFLRTLRDDMRVTVVLVERQGENAVCVDRIMDEGSPSMQKIGATWKLPTFYGAGSCFFLTDEQVASDDAWNAFSPTDPGHQDEAYRQSFVTGRKTGVWRDMGYCRKDLARLAVPVYFKEEVIAVIAVGFSTIWSDDQIFMKRIEERILSASKQIQNAIESSRTAKAE